MLLYDRNIIGSSSEIFGYLILSAIFGIFGKCSETFVWSSDNFWGILGNLGKIVKKSPLVCLYDKQNNTWPLVDMEFLFSCLARREIPYLGAPMYYPLFLCRKNILRKSDYLSAVFFNVRIDLEAKHQFFPGLIYSTTTLFLLHVIYITAWS